MQDNDQNTQEFFDALDTIPGLTKANEALMDSVQKLIRTIEKSPAFSSSQEKTLRRVVSEELDSVLAGRTVVPETPKDKGVKSKFDWGCLLIFLILSLGFYLSIYWVADIVKDEYAVGEEYIENCRSVYVTPEEKELLRRDTHVVSLLPEEYGKDRKIVRRNIRKNRKEIERRKKEAERNGGRWSVHTGMVR